MGGFGSQAFLGCDHKDGNNPRPAVMVFLPEEVVEDRDLFEAILQETEVAAHIDHQNVMSVIGLARIDEGCARIVEYADAESLMAVSERLRVAGQKMPTSVALTIISGACMGVHYAHELGRAEVGSPLIHAAIRPGTLLVSYRGHAKVSGYGAAVLAEGLRKSRGEDQARSDPYTAPEQVLGGRNAATSQTDIYGLGAVLYELLVGHPPPASDWPNFDRQVEEELRAEEVADRVPDALREIVVKALRRRAVERFQSGLEMRHKLLELELAASEAELRAFMENLFGANFPSRIARRKLLDTIERASPLPSLVLSPRPNENDSILPRGSLDDFETASSSFSIPVVDESWEPPAPSDEAAPTLVPQPAASHEAPPTVKVQVPARAASSSAGVAPAPPAAQPLTAPTPIPVSAPAPQAYQPQPPPERVVYRTPPIVYALVGLLGGGALVLAAIFLTRSEPAPVVAQPELPPAPPVAAEPPPPPPEEKPPEEKPPEPEPERQPKRQAAVQKKAPAGPGKVVVSTSPQMAIYIGGKKRGDGSAEVELKAGSHVVKGINKGLGINVSKTVKVRPGQTSKVSLKASKGGLVVDAPAGSVVFVDGKKVGSVPGLDVVELYEGRHAVLVKNGTAQYRHTVPIRAGLDITLTVNFYEK